MSISVQIFVPISVSVYMQWSFLPRSGPSFPAVLLLQFQLPALLWLVCPSQKVGGSLLLCHDACVICSSSHRHCIISHRHKKKDETSRVRYSEGPRSLLYIVIIVLIYIVLLVIVAHLLPYLLNKLSCMEGMHV